MILTFGNGFLDVVVHAQCSPGMEITPSFEGFQHRLALCHVRQQSQLQLAIVSHHQMIPFRQVSCKGLTDLLQNMNFFT